MRPILEDAARIAALQAGEVDLIAAIPHVRVGDLKRNDKLVIKTIVAPRIFHVTIDVRKPPFDNVKVRGPAPRACCDCSGGAWASKCRDPGSARLVPFPTAIYGTRGPQGLPPGPVSPQST